MNPKNRPVASSNIYTAILALTTAIVIATAAFVAIKCWTDYGTLFKIVEATR